MPGTRIPPQSSPPRTAYTISEVAASLGISERQVYAMCDRDEIESFKIGRRRLITPQALQDFLQEAQAAAS